MKKKDLHIGDVVQISPEQRSKMFGGCMMIVTEPKPWGAQGFIQGFGIEDTIGGRAYVRIKFEDMELVGRAQWI